MNNFSRGIRNAFRNGIRTVSVILILALAIGLALAMLVARQAVDKKITDVKSLIGNNITVSPAGQSGFGGGFRGSADESSSSVLTNDDVDTIEGIDHVATVTASLTARASTDDTSLTSPVTNMRGGPGQSSDSSNSSGSGANDSSETQQSFSMPISLTGTTDVDSAIETLGDATLSSGETIDGTSTDYVAIIGDQMAEENDLGVGSTFTLYDQTITVKGILASSDSSDSSYSESNSGGGRNLSIGSSVILPLATLQTISDQADDVSSITATVDSVENTSIVTTAITSALGTDDDGNNRADVTSDESNAQTTIDSLASIKTTSTFSLIACAVAASAIILLSMLMIVRERRGEIGVLKAIGAKSSTIVKQFAVESLTLTLMAAVIGLGVGILASNPLTSALVSSSSSSSSTSSSSQPDSKATGSRGAESVPNGGGASMPSGGGGPTEAVSQGFDNVRDITTQIDWTIVLYGLGAAILIALVGATTASLIVMRVRPAEAVRAE